LADYWTQVYEPDSLLRARSRTRLNFAPSFGMTSSDKLVRFG